MVGDANKEKTEAIKKMVQSFDKFGDDMTRAWAQTNDTQVVQMDESTRDRFMVYICARNSHQGYP